MTISLTGTAVAYTANGSQVAFDVTNIYFETDAELYVTTRTGDTVTVCVLNTDYTVAGAGSAAGVVTFTTAPTTAHEVRIERRTLRTQTLALSGAGAFSPANVMAVLDKLTRGLQDLHRGAQHVWGGTYAGIPLTQTPSGAAWDAEGLLISDVLDPVSDQDAATKAYVDATTTAAQDAAAAAAASAVAASSSATAADTSADLAAASAAAINALVFSWTYSATTTMADPGTGAIRFNNATMSSVTSIAFDALASNTGNPDVSAWLATLDDSTNTVKGSLRFVNLADETDWADFQITALSVSAGWVEATVTYVAHSGTFSASDNLAVLFTRAGNAGAAGAGTGDMLAANNLSDVASRIAAFNNLTARGTDIPSAATLDLSSATGLIVDVTGTTTVTAITLADGDIRLVRFTGSMLLTNGASLVLPNAADVTTLSGDWAIFAGFAAGVVRCVMYNRSNFATRFNNIKQAATESATGVVELATVAEAGTGTDTARAVTPAGLNPAEVNVVSATTCDIGAAASVNVNITGTTTITGLGTAAAGIFRRGRFAGALTLTHNATSLIIPGGANITTAANDRFEALSLGAGNWIILSYTKASGEPIVSGQGKYVARAIGTYTTNAALSTVMPNDDTIPQNTEGTEIITASITPTNTTNRIRATFQGQVCGSGSADQSVAAALFLNSDAAAVAATACTTVVSHSDDGVEYTGCPGGLAEVTYTRYVNHGYKSMTITYEWVPGSTAALTAKIRVGPNTGSVRMNGGGSSRLFGGVSAATLVLEEIVP